MRKIGEVQASLRNKAIHKNKPIWFGIGYGQSQTACTEYTSDFIVYTGAGNGVTDSLNGHGYGFVMTLSKQLFHQGYHL